MLDQRVSSRRQNGFETSSRKQIDLYLIYGYEHPRSVWIFLGPGRRLSRDGRCERRNRHYTLLAPVNVPLDETRQHHFRCA